MKRFMVTLIVSCSLFFVGCSGSESEAQKAVLDVLKDPDSAKFGKFTEKENKDSVIKEAACLTVNARNSQGGYTGDQQAFLLKDKEDKWTVYEIENISHDSCIEKALFYLK